MSGAPYVMILALACTCAAAPKSTPTPAPAPAAKAPAPIDVCGTGHLPRITEKSFADGGFAAFLSGAAKGTVAIAWDGTRAQVNERCRLDGRYTEAGGKGAWRFRATNRVLFRTDEVAGECRTATHVVAAYITRNAAPGSKPSTAPSEMDAILVPLPCPSAEDPDPAPGCIGRGLNGPARRKRADALMVDLPPERVPGADPAKVLEVFALIPDNHWGLTYAGHVNSGDCSFSRQGEWLAGQYGATRTDDVADPFTVKLRDAARRDPPPTLNWQCSNFNCLCTPVFIQCFPGRFDAIFGGPGFWTPVEPEGR